MFDNLSGLAVGLIIFTIIVVTGMVILANLGTATAGCDSRFTYNGNGSTGGLCYNNTDTTAATTTPQTAAVQSNTLSGYLGTNSGGLASWTLAIIALAVGMLFIGALMNKRKY